MCVETRMEVLARRVCDRDPVDWDEEFKGEATSDERRVLFALRTIQRHLERDTDSKTNP